MRIPFDFQLDSRKCQMQKFIGRWNVILWIRRPYICRCALYAVLISFTRIVSARSPFSASVAVACAYLLDWVPAHHSWQWLEISRIECSIQKIEYILIYFAKLYGFSYVRAAAVFPSSPVECPFDIFIYCNKRLTTSSKSPYHCWTACANIYRAGWIARSEILISLVICWSLIISLFIWEENNAKTMFVFILIPSGLFYLAFVFSNVNSTWSNRFVQSVIHIWMF